MSVLLFIVKYVVKSEKRKQTKLYVKKHKHKITVQ